MEKDIPLIGVINKTDLEGNWKIVLDWFIAKGVTGLPVSAFTGKGRHELIKEIFSNVEKQKRDRLSFTEEPVC